jgi:HEAT repeat protein
VTATASEKRTVDRIARHVANLGSPDKDVSYRAERMLIRYYGARALEPLIEVSDSPSAQVRFRAAWVLAHTHDARAYETILRLTRDPDGGVSYDAAIGLGILGDARAVEPLIALLHAPDEENSSVASAAAQGLERLGTVAAPALLNVAENSTGSAREMAIYALANIGDVDGLKLLQRLVSDAAPNIRIVAEDALQMHASSIAPEGLRELNSPAFPMPGNMQEDLVENYVC